MGIIGLGYAGLPLAMAFAEAGFDVTGHRSQRGARARRSARAAPISSTCPRSATRASRGAWTATTDYSVVSELDALTICVPTPLSKTRTPDLSYMVAAGGVGGRAALAGAAGRSCSRRPTRARPSRSSARSSSARAPWSGPTSSSATRPSAWIRATTSWDVHTTPKLVAGVTEECLRRTALLYAHDRRDGRRRRPRRWWPRRRSCTRTPSARSTSRWPTSCASCATGSGSPPGRSSRPPPASPSASCRTTRARASAATASRSCRTSSPGACASTATRRS